MEVETSNVILEVKSRKGQLVDSDDKAKHAPNLKRPNIDLDQQKKLLLQDIPVIY